MTGAFYYLEQTNFSTTRLRRHQHSPLSHQTVTASPLPASTAASAPAQTDFISFLIDYRPVKRVDLYAGVMVSNVYGGLANGYQVTQTITPTAGIRIKF